MKLGIFQYQSIVDVYVFMINNYVIKDVISLPVMSKFQFFIYENLIVERYNYDKGQIKSLNDSCEEMKKFKLIHL